MTRKRRGVELGQCQLHSASPLRLPWEREKGAAAKAFGKDATAEVQLNVSLPFSRMGRMPGVRVADEERRECGDHKFSPTSQPRPQRGARQGKERVPKVREAKRPMRSQSPAAWAGWVPAVDVLVLCPV